MQLIHLLEKKIFLLFIIGCSMTSHLLYALPVKVINNLCNTMENPDVCMKKDAIQLTFTVTDHDGTMTYVIPNVQNNNSQIIEVTPDAKSISYSYNRGRLVKQKFINPATLFTMKKTKISGEKEFGVILNISGKGFESFETEITEE